jgi:hypothetical protein
MILMGSTPNYDKPVVVTLAEALGAAIDRRQVAMLRSALAEPPCWCDAIALYRVPVDICVSNPNTTMSDGQPGMTVCAEHVDRDGYEPVQ